jgi:hypothetical protein
MACCCCCCCCQQVLLVPHSHRGCTKACSAKSMALPIAAALLIVSSYSLSGTLSATRPAPACRTTTAAAVC